MAATTQARSAISATAASEARRAAAGTALTGPRSGSGRPWVARARRRSRQRRTGPASRRRRPVRAARPRTVAASYCVKHIRVLRGRVRKGRTETAFNRRPIARAPWPARARSARRPVAAARRTRAGRARETRRRPRARALGFPRAEVPPLDVAGTQAIRRAEVGLDPVQEPEPVVTLRDVALDTLDRLHEPAAVGGVDVELTVESLHCGQPRGNRSTRTTAAPRSRVTQSEALPDPERSCPQPASRRSAKPTRKPCFTSGRWSARCSAQSHAPTAMPTDARPSGASLTRRPSTTSTGVRAGVEAWSFWETTE